MPRTKKNDIVPQTAAQELYSIESSLEALKTRYKQDSAPLEARSEELRSKLLAAMQKNRVKTIKLENGDQYIRVPKTTFEVTDERKAFQWAQQNQCLRIDKVSANKILTRTIGVPDGFEQHDEEHIRIERA